MRAVAALWWREIIRFVRQRSRVVGSLAQPVVFWLLLGGFMWVMGDVFQQYAVTYIGVSRGIPLSNTNQLWGIVMGRPGVFGTAGRIARTTYTEVIGGSIIIGLGACAVAVSSATEREHRSWRDAALRESGAMASTTMMCSHE